MTKSTNIRMLNRQVELMKRLQSMEAVREQAVEEGIIETKDDGLTWEDTFRLFIPEDAEPLERPEEEITWRQAGEMKDEILDLSGKNVAAYEVIDYYLKEFAEEHGVETERHV